MSQNPLRERLAAYAHNAWAGWHAYLLSKSVENEDGSVTIPADLVERWRRQMLASYAMLPDNEQESDRKEADHMLELVARYLLNKSEDEI